MVALTIWIVLYGSNLEPSPWELRAIAIFGLLLTSNFIKVAKEISSCKDNDYRCNDQEEETVAIANLVEQNSFYIGYSDGFQ